MGVFHKKYVYVSQFPSLGNRVFIYEFKSHYILKILLSNKYVTKYGMSTGNSGRRGQLSGRRI